jgi:hypothetical protein
VLAAVAVVWKLATLSHPDPDGRRAQSTIRVDDHDGRGWEGPIAFELDNRAEV